ncbi:MAG: CPBP family intramembrane metalloprotease [Bacteroidales bacterium]|nr:CPBP family intramembrane metalloprotease [Bacteroidales bacterium]
MKILSRPARPSVAAGHPGVATEGYFSATRHPWACLLFLLPLLAIYEGGVFLLSGDSTMSLRNGADVWLRWGLERYGIVQEWVPPTVVLGILLLRAGGNWSSRPGDPFSTLFGMTLESVLYAVALWAVARNFEAFLQHWELPFAEIRIHTTAARQLITYIGAGIYEEVLFRLGLFSVLFFILRAVRIPAIAAFLLASGAAAVAFAAAHHLGPQGEEYVPIRFLFRVLAGLYFTVLYCLRGFGIAAGAHAGYDILVGLSVG